MSFRRNPRKLTQKNLEYFFQHVLMPQYSDTEMESVDIGKGKSYDIPKLNFKQLTLKPDRTFEHGGLSWRPRDMFMQQNDGLKQIDGKFTKGAVARRVKAVKKTPSQIRRDVVSFSMKPVELIKPSYNTYPEPSN